MYYDINWQPHYHMVFYVDSVACKNADPKNVVRIFHQLFNGKDVSRRYLKSDTLELHKLDQINTLIESWRSRLFDISLFMSFFYEQARRNTCDYYVRSTNGCTSFFM